MKLTVEQEQALGRLREHLQRLSNFIGEPVFDGVLDDDSDFEKIIVGVQNASNAATALCKPFAKTHQHVGSGQCAFCHHFGDDCTGRKGKR